MDYNNIQNLLKKNAYQASVSVKKTNKLPIEITSSFPANVQLQLKSLKFKITISKNETGGFELHTGEKHLITVPSVELAIVVFWLTLRIVCDRRNYNTDIIKFKYGKKEDSSIEDFFYDVFLSIDNMDMQKAIALSKVMLFGYNCSFDIDMCVDEIKIFIDLYMEEFLILKEIFEEQGNNNE
jgi:hypothetical protein